MTPSDRLRRAINASHLSIASIAAATNIPRSTLDSFMSGETRQLRADAQTAIESVISNRGRTTLSEDGAEFDHELRSEAVALGLDPDAIARKAVEDAVKRKRFDAWIEDNREAMDANARDIRENGLWSDGLRRF